MVYTSSFLINRHTGKPLEHNSIAVIQVIEKRYLDKQKWVREVLLFELSRQNYVPPYVDYTTVGGPTAYAAKIKESPYEAWEQ